MTKRILVIDDEYAIRKAFTLALEDTEYQVDTVESGKKGFEMFKNVEYDLVYLDLKMPGWNGVKTLRELRKVDSEVNIYIITAFHNEFIDQLESAQADGIEFELLKKPIGIDQLNAITKGVLEGPISY